MKRITNLNNSFLRITIYTPNFNLAKFAKVFKKKKKSNIRCYKFYNVDFPNGII